MTRIRCARDSSLVRTSTRRQKRPSASGGRWCTPSSYANASPRFDRVVSSLEAAERRRGEFTLELTVDDVTAWLRVLNDARLALGTRLGVTEETTVDDLDPDDPATPGLAAYAWLTYLEGELVETLLEDLPE